MILVVPTHLVVLPGVLSDELAVLRVSAVNPMMMRAPVSWRPHILIAAIPIPRTLRVIRTITDFYIYADGLGTRTQDDRNRRNCGQQNRYFLPFVTHTNDSAQTPGSDVTANVSSDLTYETAIFL